MVLLPKYITYFDIPKIVEVLNEVRRSDSDVVDIDASRTVFVDTIGLCFFAATCDFLYQKGQQIQFHGMQSHLISYLSRMDLLKQCNHHDGTNYQRLDRRDSLMEIRCLKDVSEVEDVARDISKALAGTTPDYDENAVEDPMTGYAPHEYLEDDLKYAFNELLENSLTHGRRRPYGNSKVWVASQYFSKKDEIKLAIIDNGCGFLESLRGHQEAPRDNPSAIRLALKPRVSCNRDVGVMEDAVNQGIGLTVVSRMVQNAGGSMDIISGDALCKYKAGMPNGSATLSENRKWQGVGISIVVPRGNIRTLLHRDAINEIHDETGLESQEENIQFI